MIGELCPGATRVIVAVYKGEQSLKSRVCLTPDPGGLQGPAYGKLSVPAESHYASRSPQHIH